MLSHYSLGLATLLLELAKLIGVDRNLTIIVPILSVFESFHAAQLLIAFLFYFGAFLYFS